MKNLKNIKSWLRQNGADESLLDENGVYKGSLDLSSVTSLPEGFNPTVGGSLYLSSVTSLPEGFNPTVGGYLDLSSVTSLPEGFNPTVGGSLYLSSVTSLPEGFNPTVGGSLYLRSVTSLPEGFNPTVGGSLDLSSVTSLPEGFNPTVGSYLDLRSVTSLPEGFNPTVGGSLDLSSGLKYIGADASIPSSLHWKWRDKYYIKVDGIFQQVVSHRGNVYRVKNIGAKDVTYLVTDGNGRWSHGKNLKEAREDLIYKISDRDTSKYEGLTLDSVLAKADAIQCYRVITGACTAGTRGFCKTLGKMKSKYSIREIIKLTEGQYGHEAFANFFNR